MNKDTDIVLNFNNQEIKLVIRDEVDQSVMREIFKVRDYKSAEERIVKTSYPIIDVGAHAGFFSIYCRLLNPKVKIFALEPEEENVLAWQKNIKLNKIKGVKMVGIALAAESGQRNLRILSDNQNHRLLAQNISVEGFQTKKVEAVSFADFCTKNKIKKISVLKMDIEGGEYEVFDSMTDEDFSMIETVILEYHNKKDREYKVLEDKLRENGFGVQVFPSKFDKTMGFLFAINKRKHKYAR